MDIQVQLQISVVDVEDADYAGYASQMALRLILMTYSLGTTVSPKEEISRFSSEQTSRNH
jgi:hypothetical protein